MRSFSRMNPGLALILLASLAACAAPAAGVAPAPTPGSISPALPTLPQPTRAELPPTDTAAAPAPIGQILGLDYADRLWLLAASGVQGSNAVWLYDSNDNGLSWEAHALPGAQPGWVGESGGSDHVSAVRFLNQNAGWVYDPGLFATTDGGQTWQKIQLGQDVVAVAPLASPGGKTWALGRACADTGHCKYSLLAYASGLNTWAPLESFPTVEGSDQAALLRSDEQHASVLVGEGEVAVYKLWTTADGGATWSQRDMPCQVEARLAATNAGDLWLLCGGVPGAGQQGKFLYHSADGGKTWQPVASSQSSSGEGKLPIFGYADALLAFSPEQLLIGLGRSTLYLSEDAGQTWREAIPFEVANQADSSGWVLLKTPRAGEAWAALATRLFHTTNGGQSWDRVEVRR